jgi:hypothetical protein
LEITNRISLVSSTRRLWRLTVVILVLVVLGIWIWVERGAVLLGATELWIVSDAVSPADVAVVLGGGLDGRPFVAAKLYQQGLVKKVLVSQVGDNNPAVAIGVSTGHTDANRQVLLKLGVPATAIDTFGMAANKNTKEEAVALRAWAERDHPSAMIIPVEIFTARRVRWSSTVNFLVSQFRSKLHRLTRRTTRVQTGGKMNME